MFSIELSTGSAPLELILPETKISSRRLELVVGKIGFRYEARVINGVDQLLSYGLSIRMGRPINSILIEIAGDDF